MASRMGGSSDRHCKRKISRNTPEKTDPHCGGAKSMVIQVLASWQRSKEILERALAVSVLLRSTSEGKAPSMFISSEV
jgi:hypothetical protein